jgi:hypothetical protein
MCGLCEAVTAAVPLRDEPRPGLDTADLFYAAWRLGGLFPDAPVFSAAVPAACSQEGRPTGLR